MYEIELPIEIDANHQIHVQLPDNIAAQKACIIVLYETENQLLDLDHFKE